MNTQFPGAQPQRRRHTARSILIGLGSVIVLIIVIAVALTLVGCGSAAGFHPPAPASTGATVSSHCTANANGYGLTLTNDSSASEEVTGFVVELTNFGEQVGSDTEPGNGYINGTNAIQLQDWLVPSASMVFNVQPSNMPDGVNGCALITWSDQP